MAPPVSHAAELTIPAPEFLAQCHRRSSRVTPATIAPSHPLHVGTAAAQTGLANAVRDRLGG